MGSGKGCVAGLMGCVLIIVNTVFMLLGLALAILGGIAYFGAGAITKSLDIYNYIEDKLPSAWDKDALHGLNIEDYLEPAGIAVLVIGLVMFAIAVVGLCGACCKLRVLLIVYAVVVGVLVLVQVAVLVGLYGFTDKITDPIKTEWKKTITEYYAGDDNQDTVYGPVSLFWTATNQFLECCGVENYTDFHSATHWNRSALGYETPLSCCKHNDTFPLGQPQSATCNKLPLTTTDSNYDQGCFDAMQEKVKNPSRMFLYIVIGSMAVEVALIIFAICVCRDAELLK